MKLPLVTMMVSISLGTVFAQRNNWKPTDFEPLTSLPWEQESVTTEKVIERIFREPNMHIRYPVLGEYLRTMAVTEISRAFDLAIAYEGMQQPDELVSFMLPIWAKRDPVTAWERTKALFRVVGIEEGWINYDGWTRRPRITVEDHTAIQLSGFWLRRDTLTTFPFGVEESAIPRSERVRIMKEFAALWFEKFQSWPAGGGRRTWEYEDPFHPFQTNQENPLIGALNGVLKGTNDESFEVSVRRSLVAKPKDAAKIIKRIDSERLPAISWENKPERGAKLSKEFLLLWSKVDPKGLEAWAVEQAGLHQGDAWTAKCILMSQVTEVTREKWMRFLGSGANRKSDLGELAAWQPKLGVEEALSLNSAGALREALGGAAYGPGHGQPWNSSHYGMGFIRDFDMKRLPAELREEVLAMECITIMEQWGDIDVAENARFGLRVLSVLKYPPRDEWIKFFAGEDLFPDEGGVLDRTFCSLRVWAVVRPGEMREWIKTQEGADLQQALTWLLEHPWGTGPDE